MDTPTEAHSSSLTNVVKSDIDQVDDDELSEGYSTDLDDNRAKITYEDTLISGQIDLAFPENPAAAQDCYLPSYYTFNGKEKLILYYVENFRKQFIQTYPKRRPLVLAPKNECGVQKFVCSTIRPTAFMFPEFINSWENISAFLADFIVYEPLVNPIALPPRLMSPQTLLRRRVGNSFEMATLLCSMLIGAGFPAMVAAGTARHEATLVNLKNVQCPFVPDDEKKEPPPPEPPAGKYDLKDPPDLTSHLEEEVAKIEAEKRSKLKAIKDEARKKRKEFESLSSSDKYHNRRSHAWVVIIENAPWTLKPKKKITNDAGVLVDAPPSAFFIEPTTGFRHETEALPYIYINSIWNNCNYYVNRRNCRNKELNWDLNNIEEWEHLFPGEPIEMRVQRERPVQDEDEVVVVEEETYDSEKHLDLLYSWVGALYINDKDYAQRFPNEEKFYYYKKVIYERYSPFSQKDGKIKQLVLYKDIFYKIPYKKWEWFENREDLMYKMKTFCNSKKVEESFHKGRPDLLKFYEHSLEKKPKYMHFYSEPRFDALYYLIIYQSKMVFHYKSRQDRCYYREFCYRSGDLTLLTITEKFRPNPKLPSNKDVAVRQYILKDCKILIQFQYAPNCVTASTREYIKPSTPGYNADVQYDPNLTKGYVANPTEPEPLELDLYNLLLQQMKGEEKGKRAFEKSLEEVNYILDKRKSELKTPLLKFSIFDTQRNGGARAIKMQEFEDEQRRMADIASKDADYLAPYIVVYKGEVPPYKQSMEAYNACLLELKTRFVNVLNGLQRKYEDLTAESKAMKKFLNKFQDQFDNADYERLTHEAKIIELNKRMVQQRLAITHEEAQTKYDNLKQSLLKDKRLNLQLPKVQKVALYRKF